MKLRLFVLVYGAEFLNLFEQVCCRSLLQPKNIKSIQGTIVSLYSDTSSMARATELAAKLGTVEPHLIAPTGDAAQNQQRCVMEEIRRCIDTDSQMLMVCPDNFWGDGSVENLLAIAGEGAGICVAAAHPRVDPVWFCRSAPMLDNVAIDNPTLVRLAIASLHPSWAAAVPNHQHDTSSYRAGVTLSPVALDLYAVSHLLPTVFLARFTEADYILFREAIAKGMQGIFDHIWPCMLVNQERQRVVGSSDAVFVVELTPADSHNVPLTPNDRTKPNQYHRDAPHIRANRNHVAIWRAA